MDPNACYLRWLSAETRTERRDAARDYNAWLDRGGFRAALRLPRPAAAEMVVDRLSEHRAYGYSRHGGIIGARFAMHRRWMADYRPAVAAPIGGAS